LFFDDLDDAPCPWFNQHRTAVHHGVSVLANAVFRWNVVISDTVVGKDRPDPNILAVLI
jgi:hypothetical protein